jgi:DNA-binding transcriptional MerR regulator
VRALIPSRRDGFLTTAEAAQVIGVRPETIRQWRRRGWLAMQGLDERGYPLHTPEAVRVAERRIRENGIRASGIDPRVLRKFVRTLDRET